MQRIAQEVLKNGALGKAYEAGFVRGARGVGWGLHGCATGGPVYACPRLIGVAKTDAANSPQATARSWRSHPARGSRRSPVAIRDALSTPAGPDRPRTRGFHASQISVSTWGRFRRRPARGWGRGSPFGRRRSGRVRAPATDRVPKTLADGANAPASAARRWRSIPRAVFSPRHQLRQRVMPRHARRHRRALGCSRRQRDSRSHGT
jgi:hypothetical protein